MKNSDKETEQVLSIRNNNRKRFIKLTRDDLVKFKCDLPIEEIRIYDFKSSSITRDEIHKADVITFNDGDESKELKNKYRVW